MRRAMFFIALVFALSIQLHAQKKSAVVETTLNGLQLVFDANSGSLLKMAHPLTGTIIQANPDSAGLVEVAYPIEEFEPLRLATRFSKNAKITKSKDQVTVYWDELGGSRSMFKFPGKISATVTFKAEPDGESVSLNCQVNNKTELVIPQVVFPDFFGIVPFNGREGTEFRTGGAAIKPFVDMVVDEKDYFFALNASLKEFRYGFVLDAKNPVIKWMDFGGRKSGLSFYSKDWGDNGGYNESIYLKLSEITNKLRYMRTLTKNIEPGKVWNSPEYILTPHANGWAEGIEPYRKWAQQNIKRLYPLPDHVRDGLGFRTVWMNSTFWDDDSLGIHFKFKDLPRVARESKEHGLDELNLWGWHENLWLPLPPPWKYVGTEAEMSQAVKDCKKEGVNVSPFLTVSRVNNTMAEKYGLAKSTANYMYDTEFIPYLNPHYSKKGHGAMVIQSNKQWQKDVYTSMQHLIDMGIPSFGWDQFFSDGSDRSLDTVITAVLKMSKGVDPQSTFSGEIGTNLENECNYLDYGWNWDYADNCDYRPLINALQGGPRINLNIDRSVIETKIGFADNLYLNVVPHKPDAIDASDDIANHPELSAALKQCARLRKQFLSYFTNSRFIGDCILTKDVKDAHISAYVQENKMMVIVVNKAGKRAVNFEGSISAWMKSAKGKYQVKEYNDGVPAKNISVTGSRWIQKTPVMDPLDICIYEVTGE